MMDDKPESVNPQAYKFKQAARELECDPDEKAWDERLRKVAKAKPTSGPPEEKTVKEPE
jgi:hypothetical protein